jgi:hypothetical protein
VKPALPRTHNQASGIALVRLLTDVPEARHWTNAQLALALGRSLTQTCGGIRWAVATGQVVRRHDRRSAVRTLRLVSTEV